jgi:hypothetical protein
LFLAVCAIVFRLLIMSDPEEQQTVMGEKSRAALSFFVSLCLFGLAALFFYSGSLLFQCVSVVPALLGLLVLYGGIHALFASRTPPTTLKLETFPLRIGTTTGVVIRQAGPVVFESLRANLVCERSERQSGRKSRTVTFSCQENFFDSGPAEVVRMDVQEFRAAVTVPADAEPSREEPGLRIEWRIEVWGRVKGNADFMRPFAVEVVE